MSNCVVVGCEEAGTGTVEKAAESGPWVYVVCQAHSLEVDAGAVIHDNPDGYSIVLEQPDEADAVLEQIEVSEVPDAAATTLPSFVAHPGVANSSRI